MPARTCRVGLHGRNNVTFETVDYELIKVAKIEALKMMGQTQPAVFKRLKENNADLDIVTRLYDDRFGQDRYPSPEQFAEKQIPIIKSLQPYCTKFEVHNEPNHLHRYEGWGQEDHHAQDFNTWFLRVYNLLKNACPWALLGFPGLAIPHRDLEWVEICRPAVERADWLGVHCYWQTPPGQERNHLADFWGLRFKYYHEKFPDKIQEITECGNSNIQANPPINISEDNLGRQYIEYYQELFKYPYINSASFFMLSSQDPTWDFFCWRAEDGRIKPVAGMVGQMQRSNLMSPYPPAGATTTSSSPATTTSNITAIATTAVTTVPEKAVITLASTKIIDLIDNLPKNTAEPYNARPLTVIRQLVIHHTAVSDKVGPERIAKHQVKQGQPGITYHYYLMGDGTLYQTNYLTTVSNHTPGHDQTSIAICFAGNFTDEIPTQAQLKAGADLCTSLMQTFSLPLGNLKGATELVATQSPGSQWLTGKIWKNLLLQTITQGPNGASSSNGSSTVVTSPPVTTPPVTVSQPVTTITDPNAKITELNTKIAELTAQLAQSRAAYNSATQQITALNTQNTQLQTGLNQAKSDMQIAINNQTNLSNRIVQLEASLATTQSTPGRSGGGDVATLQDRIAELELQLSFSHEAALGTGSASGVSPQPISRTVPKPVIVNLTTTLTRHPTNRYQNRQLSDIKRIIIHHSGVSASIEANRIAEFNVTKNNWPGIGFHYFIDAQGTIQQTNDLTAVSYHVGDQNISSVGLALAGNFEQTIPTETQLTTAGSLIAWLLAELNLPLSAVKGHKEFANTPCPGQQWDIGQSWEKLLISKIESALSNASNTGGTTISTAKNIYHYLLLWQNDTDWAKDDFLGLTNYIGKFRPSLGFDAQEAMKAQYVTIIGSTSGVSSEIEGNLRANGCQVERLAGNSPQATQALLDNLASTNRRFLSLT